MRQSGRGPYGPSPFRNAPKIQAPQRNAGAGGIRGKAVFRANRPVFRQALPRFQSEGAQIQAPWLTRSCSKRDREPMPGVPESASG